jgi:hypothetical protein
MTAMREALPVFGGDRRLRPSRRGDDGGGDAHLLADADHPRQGFQSLNTRGLFPAGEGAGYAGGILSAAVDGIKVGRGGGAERRRENG